MSNLSHARSGALRSTLHAPRRAAILTIAALAALAVVALSCVTGAAKKGATMSGCAICHTVASDALARSRHAPAGVTCVTCHGQSKAHLEDENNAVKPDRVFTRQDADPFCLRCHKGHCPHAGAAGKTCADCHGSHGVKIPKRDA